MNYRIVRRLGRGGMGVVDLAVDDNGDEYALKRLSLHGTPDEMVRARQRIHREAEVLRQLDHPAIVRLHDVLDEDDDLILVMDHLAGGNLSTLVNEHGPLPAAQVREIADRLLDGLATAHRRGIVHRDIKPANILFDHDGRAHLVDFGAAIHRDATPGLTVTAMVMGTPGFMAPEQARGEPATAASDIFSLGATLFFAATGHGPFGTADPRVLMLRAAADQIAKPPRDLPADLRHFLEELLDPDPTRRPTAAHARGGTDGTRVRPAVNRRSGLRPANALTTALQQRRRGMIIAATATLGLLLLIGVIGAVAQLRSTDSSTAVDPAPTAPEPAPETTEACVDKPYQPCGNPPAPNTDGYRCIGGAQDYDGDPTTGCEAEPDGIPDGTELTAENPIRGTIVPANDVDRFRRPVEDRFNLFGNGTIHFRFTAPAGAVYRITILDEDGGEMGSEISTNGQEIVLSFVEPSPFTDDSTVLTVEIRNEPGFRPSAGPYLLTTSGQY